MEHDKYLSMVSQAQKIVFLTGAGVSTESGLTDYKQIDLRWEHEDGLTREDVMSRAFFDKYPEEFWKHYRQLDVEYRTVSPNLFHRLLRALASNGKHVIVVTQNVDGLHGASELFIDNYTMSANFDPVEYVKPTLLPQESEFGSYDVFEVHGNSKYNVCLNETCKDLFDKILSADDSVPMCPKCGERLKPNVVLYGEQAHWVNEAKSAVLDCDLLIVAGSSLKVEPISTLPHMLNGGGLYSVTLDEYDESEDRQKSLWINTDKPPMDYSFTESFLDKTGDFAKIFLND